jgi:UDP-N-acetylmuramoyl-tripeptide--D-alanyl-D-alanine ligase
VSLREGFFLPKTLILNKPVIAITGSAGKSTTKEMIASILKRRWNIFKSYGNFNYYKCTIGNARRIRSYHRAAVLEFAMGSRGQIRKHCQIIRPNMGVITNVGTAHIGHVGGTVQNVAKAKSELIKHMKQTGFLVINADDVNSRLLETESFKGKIVTVGIEKEATYRAHNIRQTGKGMHFQLQLNGKEHEFFIPTLGVHNVYNALHAIAIAHKLGFSPAVMQEGLKQYVKFKSRLAISRIGQDITLIDDSYSANPDAVKAAIDVLCTLGEGPKVAVLGTMMAMGKYSIKGHQEVGEYAALKNIDRLYTYGESAKQFAAGAQKAGFPFNRIYSFTTQAGLQKHLVSHLKPGTTVLVKGSRKMKLEDTVEYIKKHI